MPAFLPWVSEHSVAYWLPAVTSFVALLASACLAGRPASRSKPVIAVARSPLVFAVLVVLTLVAFRWPVWFHAADQNPDEAQMIAGAITLREFPVFWKHVDGTTHGPLNDYLLTAASFLGVPLTFLGARLVATLLQAGSLILLWATLRPWIPERAARLGILPGLAVWAFSTFHDLVQYSSESLSVALLAAGACCLSAACRCASVPGRRLFLALCGLFLGMVPFAKLQGIPIAAAIAVVGGVSIWRGSCSSRGRGAGLAWLAGGGLAFPALTALLLSIYGLVPQFMAAYIQSNLVYVDDSVGPGRILNGLIAFMSVAPGFPVFALGTLAFALVFLWAGLGHPSTAIRRLLASVWIIGLAALYAVIAPGREFPHYLHFLVLPVSALAAVHLAAASTAPSFSGWQSPRTAAALFFALTLAPQALQRHLDNHPYLESLPEQPARFVSGTGQLIRMEAQAGDTLAVWGWMPELFVETGLPQGTRDGQTERMMNGGPMQAFYRERYLRDFIQRKPAWFVDAVGPRNFGYHDRQRFGHEMVPALAAHVAGYYTFISDVEGIRTYRLAPERSSQTVD